MEIGISLSIIILYKLHSTSLPTYGGVAGGRAFRVGLYPFTILNSTG